MELKNFDKLVQSVTSNILEKLELKTEYNLHDKSCLLLLPNIGFGMKDYYTYIERQFPGYNFYVGKDKSLSSIQNGDNNQIRLIDLDLGSKEFSSTLDNVDMILILGLKISQMKTLIEADDSEDFNHIILGSLMANKPVTLMLNTNNSMYQKISNVVNDIENMGIHVVNIQNQISVKKTTLQSNELITEDFVTKLGRNGSREIVLHKKQLITPLAKDKLRELKIEVKYVKEDKSWVVIHKN